MENSPPHTKRAPLRRLNLRNLGEKSCWILAKTFFFFFFFWRSPNFGRKKRLNFGFRPKNHSEFWRRPFFFFGDQLILGGKNLWISDVSETFRLKFRTNRLKLIQGQWKFESTSYAHFSLFQNSPPLFKILATRLIPTRCQQQILSWMKLFSSKCNYLHSILPVNCIVDLYSMSTLAIGYFFQHLSLRNTRLKSRKAMFRKLTNSCNSISNIIKYLITNPWKNGDIETAWST